MNGAIEIKGLDDVLGKIKSLRDVRFVNATLTAGAKDIREKLIDYPRSRSTRGRYSLRTKKPLGYYKRGTGWFYPLVRKGKVRGYRNSKATSETLNRKWTIASRGPSTVVVGNNVSYGPYVQSAVKVNGKGPQTRVHKATGWKTAEQVAKEEEKRIVARIEQELQRRFGG